MKVTIVGFGTMGRQIAQVFAQHGHDVTATDENRESLKAGLEEIEKGPFGVRAAATKGKIAPEETTKVLGRIQTLPNLEEACQRADLVVEAVYEDLSLKQRLFQKIDAATRPGTLLASNTSTLSIRKIAANISHKERILGMHFFNPAQATKLVEIVKTNSTSSSALEQAVQIAKQIGKTSVVSEDEPGFIANRLGLSFYQEASKLLEEGTASISDIDTAMKLGFGHPMGPFEVADLVGLDTRLRNLESMFQATGDPKWIPSKSLREMVNQGYLGDPSKKRGSKGGYYEYNRLMRQNP